MRLYFVGMRLSCRIEVQGVACKHLSYIHAFWHQNLPLYFITHSKRPKHKVIWMQHPKWYMKPIHFLLWWSGIEIAYGSSGNSGQKALDQIISCLKNGYSSALNPDGPKGPPKQVKKGIIQMSLESGAPIQVISFKCSHYFKLSSWDEKIIPMPFSKIIVEYAQPLSSQDYDFITLKNDLEYQLIK